MGSGEGSVYKVWSPFPHNHLQTPAPGMGQPILQLTEQEVGSGSDGVSGQANAVNHGQGRSLFGESRL